jgi:GMP synthase-like glutamine amidotransferase
MLHIIQNDPEVPPGNLAEALTVPHLIHRPYCGEPLPELQDITALIVLGGAMGANDDQRYPFLTALKELIRAVVAAQIPYLGICLGGQLLAAALDTAVASNRWEELGTHAVTLTEAGTAERLFSGVAATFSTFQWHHDSFDLPANATLLASSPACRHQAFRIGHNAWGLQFHPEVTPAIIRSWCAWDPATAATTEVLVADFTAVSDSYHAVARCLWRNFLSLAEIRP